MMADQNELGTCGMILTVTVDASSTDRHARSTNMFPDDGGDVARPADALHGARHYSAEPEIVSHTILKIEKLNQFEVKSSKSRRKGFQNIQSETLKIPVRVL